MVLDWLAIEFNLFHFIRLQWLWLFAPLFLLNIIILLGHKSKNDWQKIIAPTLRKHVIQKGNKFAHIGPLIVSTLVLSLMIIAAAGPTWKKIELPGAKSETILLIALDLSPSMLVGDVSPNRLERAKYKIKDLLDANPGSKVGLIVYAGTCHPVIAPCLDYKLINYQLSSLTPAVMPLMGTNIKHALNYADTVFSRTDAPCTLLLISDALTSNEAKQLIQFSNKSIHHIEILQMATLTGGKVPGYKKGTFLKYKGENVISKLDKTVTFELQKEVKINVNTISLNKDDTDLIAKKVRENLEYQSDSEKSDEAWEELGFILLWPVAFFILLWFRKGWMVQMSLVLLLLSSCSSKIEKWDDLWFTDDYQGQKAMNSEQFNQAAEKYESLQHKGIAYFKAEDYETAIEVFKQDSSASGLYNLGLAYAADGQNQLASEVFLLAQEQEPNNTIFTNTIKKNDERLRQIDSLRSLNPGSVIEIKPKEKDKGPLNEREAKSKDEELSSDNEVKELPKDGNRVTDEVETETRKAEEFETPPEDFKPQQGEAAKDVLIREISADPSEFLKRRFRFQYEKYYAEEPKPENIW